LVKKHNHKKNLFCNQYERLSYKQANIASEKYGAHVFSKVRVADCLDIDQLGLSRDGYRYALSSHFDFVIFSEDYDVLFSIECDGPQHWNDPKVIKRDKIKNNICETGKLPLLRIDKTFLSTSAHISMLNFLIECWFLNESFKREKLIGNISQDEPFDPINLCSSDDSGPSKSLFDLINPVRRRIEKKHGWPPVKNTSITGHLTGKDRYDYCHGLFTVIGEVNTYGKGACRFYLFEPVPPEDLASIIAEHNMYLALEKILDGKSNSVKASDVEEVIFNHSKRIESNKNITETILVQ